MDKELELVCLEKLAAGDHRAFEILYLHYHPQVVRFLCGFLKDEEEAFDMAQDIFLKVWNNRLQAIYIRSFSAYLFTMARNQLTNHYESMLVKARFEEQELQRQNGYDMNDDLLAHDLDEWLNRLVGQMPEQRRNVFRMSRQEGLSNDEIASHLRISKRTVENHITTVLKALRHALKRFSCLISL